MRYLSMVLLFLITLTLPACSSLPQAAVLEANRTQMDVFVYVLESNERLVRLGEPQPEVLQAYLEQMAQARQRFERANIMVQAAVLGLEAPPTSTPAPTPWTSEPSPLNR